MATVLVRVIADTESAVAGLDAAGGAAAKLSGGVGDLGGALTAWSDQSKAAASAADQHEQAMINVEKAQKTLKESLEKYGKGSVEAREAQLALNQAQRDAEPPSAIAEWGAKLEGMAPLVMGFVGAMDLLTLALNANAITAARNAASLVATKVAQVASTAATGIATAAQWLWNIAMTANPIGLIILAVVALVAVIVLIATKTTWFQDIWKVVWETIKTVALAVWNFLKAAADAFMVGLKATWAGIQWLWDKTVAIFNGIKNAVQTAINFVVGIIKQGIANWIAVFNGIAAIPGKVVAVFTNILNFLAGIPAKMIALARNLMKGFADGIEAGIQFVKEKIKLLGSLIPDSLKSILGIHSPSKVMADIGRQAVAGLASGLDKGLPQVEKAIGAAGDAITGLSASPALDITATGSSSVSGASGGGDTYNITVTVPVGADLAEAGRQIEIAIMERKRQAGKLAFS